MFVMSLSFDLCWLSPLLKRCLCLYIFVSERFCRFVFVSTQMWRKSILVAIWLFQEELLPMKYIHTYIENIAINVNVLWCVVIKTNLWANFLGKYELTCLLTQYIAILKMFKTSVQELCQVFFYGYHINVWTYFSFKGNSFRGISKSF